MNTVPRLTNASPTRDPSWPWLRELAATIQNQSFQAAALHIVTSNPNTPPLPGVAELLYKAGLAFAPQPPPANSLGLSDAFLQPQPHEQQLSLLRLLEFFAAPASAPPPIELGIIDKDT